MTIQRKPDPQEIVAIHRDPASLPASMLMFVGRQLGYYQALDELGSLTPDEMAAVTDTDEAYAHDWLHTSAGCGQVSFSPRTHRFSLPRQAAGQLSHGLGGSFN